MQPFVNDKTIAQLASEKRTVVRIVHNRSNPVDALFNRLEYDITAFLLTTVNSNKPLDESVFMVTFDGKKTYTANFPESLLPAIAARKDFLLNKEGAKHIFDIVTVDVLRKGTTLVSDDNFATVKIHADESWPDDNIKDAITAHFANHGLFLHEGKAGINFKRPRIHLNFAIKDTYTVDRTTLKNLHILKFGSAATCWFSERFCKTWRICKRCHGTNDEREWPRGCSGRCELHDKKRKIAQVAGPSTSFGDASSADF